MTYAQIQEIEEYIKEIRDLKGVNNDDNKDHNKAYDYAEKLDTIHKKISANLGDYSLKLDWNKALEYSEHNTYYYVSYKVSNIADIMIAALRGILNAISYYPLICSVRDDISLGEKTNEYSDKKIFIIKTYEKYNDKIEFSDNIKEFVKSISIFHRSMANDTVDSFFTAVLDKLKIYLTEIPFRNQTQQSNVSSFITVNQSNNQSSSQTVQQDISIAIENSLKELDDCESVSEDEIKELKNQILEIQKLLENKKGNKKNIGEKIKAVLKWIADKGTDVMIATLPAILNILCNVK